MGLCDANWGLQDQSKPSHKTRDDKYELFKTELVSGHMIMMSIGPISWSSKCQKITARSSAEVEIYATDECVKNI